MQHGRRDGGGGSGGDSIAFHPVAAEDVPGKRVTTKICEQCGKVFLRDRDQEYCEPCASSLEARKETPLRVEPDVPRTSCVAAPQAKKKLPFQITPRLAAAWDAWLKEKEAAAIAEKSKVVRECQLAAVAPAPGDGRMPRIHAKGRRLILTPEERKRRRNEWKRGYRARQKFFRRAAPAATPTIH